METITVEIPKGFMNVGVSVNGVLYADTNDGANWDTLRFPLPAGDWKIHSQHGKKVVLVDHTKQKAAEVVPFRTDQVVGESLIYVQHNAADESCSGESEEVVMHFSKGKEISVYLGGDGRIMVEGD